ENPQRAGGSGRGAGAASLTGARTSMLARPMRVVMSVLHLEPLPPRTSKGELLQLLCGSGGIDRALVGRIDLQGATAAVEVPDAWLPRLVKALDGATLRDRRLRAWAGAVGSGSGPEDHFQRLARLLDMESRAEAERALAQSQRLSGAAAEQSGNSLLN